MAKATMVFQSDDKDVIASIDKMNKKLAELEAAAKTSGDKTKKVSDDATSGFRQAAQSIGGMVTGMVTLEAGVNLVVSGYRDWRKEMEELARASSKMTESIVKDLAKAGRLQQGGQYQQFIDAMPGATRDQASQIFRGVQEGMPMASLREQGQIAFQIGKLAPTGMDLEQLGQTAGEYKTRLGADMKPDDVIDMVTKMNAIAGGSAQKLTEGEFQRTAAKAVQMGALDREQALALGLESLSRGETADPIEAMLGAAVGEHQIQKTSSKGFREFVGMDPKQRVQAMLNDPKVAEEALGKEQALKLRGFNRGTYERMTQELKDAQTGDFAEQEVRSLEKFQGGRDAIGRQKIAMQADVLQREREYVEHRFKQAQAFVESQTKDSPVTQQRLRNATSGPLSPLVTMSNDPAGGYLKEARRIGAATDKDIEDFNRLYPADRHQREQTEAIKEQTQVLKGVQRNQRAGGARDHVEGR